MTDYRNALVQLYHQYNPERLKDVDRLLTTFKGREEMMLDALRSKYTGKAGTQVPPQSDLRDQSLSGEESPPIRVREPQTNTVELRAPAALSSSGSQRAAPAVRPEVPRPGSRETAVVAAAADGDPLLRMNQLVEQMSAVDLEALVEQVSALVRDAVTHRSWQRDVTPNRSTNEAELFLHLLKFMQFFVTCSTEFVTLAQNVCVTSPSNAQARASSPLRQSASTPHEPASPPPRPHHVASQSHSPPPPESRARTKTPLSASPDHVPPAIRAPPTPLSPPPAATAQLTLAAPRQGRTLTVSPSSASAAMSVLEPLGELAPGDTILLAPGHYSENLLFTGAGRLTLRAAYPGTPVIVRALRATDPILRVKGAEAEVVVSGIVFVGDRPINAQAQAQALAADAATHYVADASLPAVPLVAASHGSHVVFDGCHFYRCGTAAVTAVSAPTRIELRLCLISLCAFAGVYAHRGGTIELIQSRVKCCEVGVRAASSGSTLVLTETTIENCATDGVVLHGASTAQMDRSSVFNNKSNGALIASGASLEVSDSTIELNVMYGVQRFRGSYLHLKNSFIRDNGLLPINDTGE